MRQLIVIAFLGSFESSYILDLLIYLLSAIPISMFSYSSTVQRYVTIFHQSLLMFVNRFDFSHGWRQLMQEYSYNKENVEIRKMLTLSYALEFFFLFEIILRSCNANYNYVQLTYNTMFLRIATMSKYFGKLLQPNVSIVNSFLSKENSFCSSNEKIFHLKKKNLKTI